MLENVDIADATLSPESLPSRPGGIAGRLALPAEYPELRLFGLLIWKFGHPNGPLSLFDGRPDGDADAPFKWDFLFVPEGELRLHVIRNGGGIELMWWGDSPSESDLLAYLKINMALHHDDITAAVDKLEKYTLILNPYVRHRNITALALKELEQIDIEEPTPLEIHAAPEAIEDHLKQLKAYMEASDRQASLMLLLVTESAFMAEAYINLLISILARKELRDTPALMKNALKQKWRDKVDRLHVDCYHFPAAIDPKEPRLEAATTMFDIRNKAAHSTPHKVDMAVGKMWFFKKFPVLKKGEPFSKFVIAFSNQHPSLEQAKSCKKAADEFVEYLTELIDEEVRDDIRFVTSRNPLGFNETKGIYGVPFGDVVALSVSARPMSASDTANRQDGESS